MIASDLYKKHFVVAHTLAIDEVNEPAHRPDGY